MSSIPPAGSAITISRQNPDEVLCVPHSRKGVMQYFIAAFIVFWFGGWVMGFKSAAGQLMTEQDNMFLVFVRSHHFTCA